jgi:hypothetical protein
MANSYVYDPSEIVVNVGGASIEEFDEVKIEFDEDFIKTYTASNGSIVFIENNNRTGKVTITMPQYSSSNNILGEYAKNFSTISILVTDASGNSFGMASAKCVKHPGMSFKKDDQTNRDWVFAGIVNTINDASSETV